MPAAALKPLTRSARPTSTTRSWEQLAAVGLGALAALGIVRKLRRLCVVAVAPTDVAVVFNRHRRSVLSTSEDRSPLPEDADPAAAGTQPTTSNVVVRVAKQGVRVAKAVLAHGLQPLLFPACRTYVVRPPLPVYGVFTLPRAVLQSATGVAVDCVVADVPVTDGVLRITLTIVFFLGLHELNRYLTLLGPVAPHEALGRTVSQVLRQLARKCSSGILLAKQRRTTVFLPDLTTQLQTALCADCGLRLKAVTIEAVQLMDAPASPSR